MNTSQNTAVNKMGRSNIEQARFIQGTLGIKVAAKYLKNRGWSVEASLWILCNK